MREIEFRGKSVEHNVWVCGYYIKAIGDLIVEKRSSISTMEYVVEENSVGQFTGLRDKHGVKIYEGDIVRLHALDRPKRINWDVKNAGWCLLENGYPVNGCNENTLKSYEVIGNIYDNPELLGE